MMLFVLLCLLHWLIWYFLETFAVEGVSAPLKNPNASESLDVRTDVPSDMVGVLIPKSSLNPVCIIAIYLGINILNIWQVPAFPSKETP